MEYVSKIELEIDGQVITDFKTFKEGTRVLRKPIKLMNKTGHVKVVSDFTMSVDYVIPVTGSEFDFASVEEGRLSVIFPNGKRITWINVSSLEIGETTFDGENEAVRPVNLCATGRIEE